MDYTAVKIIIFVVAFLLYLIQIIGIPGNFAVVLASLAYLIFSDTPIGWGKIILILVLAISGEIVESIMGLLGAKKFGASKKGMVAAGIGGLVGGILGSMVLPIVGSILGVFLGIFFFTFMTEYRLEERDAQEAKRAGLGAVLGKVFALAYKYSVGMINLIIFGFFLFSS